MLSLSIQDYITIAGWALAAVLAAAHILAWGDGD